MKQRSYLGMAVLAVLIVLLNAACDTMARKPETIQEALYATSSYGVTLTRSVNDAYLSRSISKEQQLAALAVLQKAKDSVQSGLDAYRIGDYQAAQSKLDVAEAALRSIAILVERIGEPI